MKKYVSCFLFFLVLTAGCLVSLFVLTIDPPRQQAAEAVSYTHLVFSRRAVKESIMKSPA